jgi:DNA-binding CsgD family transcriptional regulator
MRNRPTATSPTAAAGEWPARASATSAASAQPRRTAVTGPDALTSAERPVAGLAADRLSNRQIAQHLFITQATVETHLRHAFRKLGITARGDLKAQLAR